MGGGAGHVLGHLCNKVRVSSGQFYTTGTATAAALLTSAHVQPHWLTGSLHSAQYPLRTVRYCRAETWLGSHLSSFLGGDQLTLCVTDLAEV